MRPPLNLSLHKKEEKKPKDKKKKKKESSSSLHKKDNKDKKEKKLGKDKKKKQKDKKKKKHSPGDMGYDDSLVLLLSESSDGHGQSCRFYGGCSSTHCCGSNGFSDSESVKL